MFLILKCHSQLPFFFLQNIKRDMQILEQLEEDELNKQIGVFHLLSFFLPKNKVEKIY